MTWNSSIDNNSYLHFTDKSKPDTLILFLPCTDRGICIVEIVSRAASQRLTIPSSKSSLSINDLLNQLYSLAKVEPNQEIALVLYDSFLFSDAPAGTTIIDLKLIVEYLFPGLADYELDTIFNTICQSNDSSSLQPLLRKLYQQLITDDDLNNITRACLARISHDLAFFLVWFIENARRFQLNIHPDEKTGRDLFPEDSVQLQTVMQQIFWVSDLQLPKTKENATEPECEESPHPIQDIKSEVIQKIFEDTSRFSSIPGYLPRQTQIDYAWQVMEGLNNEGVSLIEAGTGTGKTMGYAIPCMYFLAVNPTEKILIATTTKNLQSQVFFKDLPEISKLDPQFEAIPIALLKGKANYFCLHALIHEFYRDFIAKRGTAEDQLLWLFFLRLITVPWCDLESIPVGISLRFDNIPDFISRINSADHCYPDSCSFSPCMYEAVLAIANKSQLIVTNHHLLFYIDNYLNAPWQNLIVDESEQLPSAALACFSSQVDSIKIKDICERYLNGKNTISLRQAFGRYLAKIGGSIVDPEIISNLDAIGRITTSISENLQVLTDHSEEKEGSEIYLNQLFGNELAVNESIQGINTSLFELVALISSTIHKLPSKLPKYLSGQINTWARDVEALSLNLGACLQQNNSRYHCVTFSWLGKQKWRIECKPLYTDYLTHKYLLEHRRSMIFTSASLALEEDGLDFIKESLGILLYDGNIIEKQIPSPQDYYKNAIGLIYRGMRYPEFIEEAENYEEYLAELADNIEFLISAAMGKTLVLFTNSKKMNSIFSRIDSTLAHNGILPLIQNGSSLAEIELFKKRSAAALFGLNRFWRGVDIPGKALQQLIIVQLPRSYHLSLFWKKRQADDAEKMERYYRNQSYFNFRQMVGRLIRKEDDSGLIILLDSRPAAHAFILNTPITLDKWRFADTKAQLRDYISQYIV